MEINFIKENDLYIAEFEVTNDFNIHIERENHGMLAFYQKTVANGEYAEITDFKQLIRDKIFDSDFTGVIYPKYIKVVSGVEVINSELTIKV